MIEPQQVTTIELAVHAAEAIIGIPGAAYVGWKMVRAANRILDVLKDFPPHRHMNGKIIYPKGFAPSEIETLEGQH